MLLKAVAAVERDCKLLAAGFMITMYLLAVEGTLGALIIGAAKARGKAARVRSESIVMIDGAIWERLRFSEAKVARDVKALAIVLWY